MDYCSLEDAWGVKTFRTQLPDPAGPGYPADPATNGQWPVSGPFGWRTPGGPKQEAQPMNPVTMMYMNGGIEGILAALPPQALDELRAKLMVGQLNIVAGVLLFGFVVLILWDVLFKRR